ncbi:RasGAP C-terminus-domain-containing protein [Suillus subluteus]|nr:RasGAP C-terminus-domain-containing protein [Suillus subluteus]
MQRLCAIKVKEMLRELEKQNITEVADGYKLMQDEVAAELTHLGNLREKVVLETKSLEALEQYKTYLQNIRLTVSKDKGSATGAGVVTVTRRQREEVIEISQYRFTHAQLEKEGIIVKSNFLIIVGLTSTSISHHARQGQFIIS